MWISKKIADSNRVKETICAEITDTNSGTVSIQNGGEYRDIYTVAPRGISYIPVEGDKTIAVPVGNDFICIGTIMDDEDLEPGEIKLSSQGGANIILKNDGSVVINGTVF